VILAALLFAASASQSVAQAERAFAAQAQQDGQWAAFRAFAASDAILYAPDRRNAQQMLANQPEPAATLQWRPARTITACDGTLAYSTGPWTRSDGKAGGFGTIWRHDAGGWAWIYDGGHDGGPMASAPAGTVETTAACAAPTTAGGLPADVAGPVIFPTAQLRTPALPDMIEASDGPLPAQLRLGPATGQGASADHSLRWRINPVLGGKPGAHLLRLWQWDGFRFSLAVFDLTS
jgi:hypothetical protein